MKQEERKKSVMSEEEVREWIKRMKEGREGEVIQKLD